MADDFSAALASQRSPDTIWTQPANAQGVDSQVARIDVFADKSDTAVAHQYLNAPGVFTAGRIKTVLAFVTDSRTTG